MRRLTDCVFTVLDDGVSLFTFIFCYCCVHIASAKSILLVGVLPVGNQGCMIVVCKTTPHSLGVGLQ